MVVAPVLLQDIDFKSDPSMLLPWVSLRSRYRILLIGPESGGPVLNRPPSCLVSHTARSDPQSDRSILLRTARACLFGCRIRIWAESQEQHAGNCQRCLVESEDRSIGMKTIEGLFAWCRAKSHSDGEGGKHQAVDLAVCL